MVRYLSAFTVLFVLALAAPALATDEAVIGGTPSVKAAPSHGRTVIRFKKAAGHRLFKKIAGRELNVSCDTAPLDPTSHFGSSASEDFVAPKRGSKLTVDVTAGKADWCEVLVVRKHGKVAPIVAVALTSAGETFLDERVRALVVDGLVTSASFDAKSGHYPTTDQIVAESKGFVIGLASPSDPVPTGKYGFYSDGAQHIEAVAMAPSGKRLFEDVSGDTVSTNVLGYIGSLNFG